jgi:CHAT domain-containing protein
MIRLWGDRRQPDRALTLAERSRARTLVEALATEQGAFPVDPATAYVDIPPATTVLYYVALDDRLLIWTLSRERRTFADTPVGRGDLARLLGQYRSEMEASASEGREMPSLAALYGALIRPVVDAVPAQSNLVVVPDGPLHAVPFAALVRREDRSYVIERHAVQIAPSLTVFLTATARGTAGKSGGSVLVLGNPRNDSADGVDLPEAEAEAREVASLYDGAELLTGQAATKAAFLERAGRHTIVHFAGHAIANDVRHDLSRLVLAGSDDSTLEACSLENWRTSRLRTPLWWCSLHAVAMSVEFAGEKASSVWRGRFSPQACRPSSPACGTSTTAPAASC